MVFEAGIVTFVRTILIIALVYYALKIIVKYLFPFVLQRFINKQQEKFHQQQNTANNSHSESKKTQAAPQKEKLGDYVDYEEVE